MEDLARELGAGPPMSPSIFPEEVRSQVTVFGLNDALAYAMRHARDLQSAKEDLYLAALDLSLERHLWTPQFVADVQTQYTDFPKDADLDRALSTVSEVAVSQRLPLGGTLTARAIHSMMHDIVQEVSKGESGQLILEGTIPLLRGAGRVAYESRYQAERELIYAVRRFERFRRNFLVDIARDYFDLQGRKAAIANTYRAYINRRRDWFRAEFIHRMGRSRTIAEVPRARSVFRSAEVALVSAKESYETALDRFKIRIGMPVEQLLDVLDQDEDRASEAVDALLPDVDETTAAETAVKYRLDLLNLADQVDDARRGVKVAKNRILPDLDFTGRVTYDSDPAQLRAANLREERRTWEGIVQLRVDDRKTERNAYRASLITLRRAQRDYEQFADTVRADARRALRRIRQQENIRRIQEHNVRENEIRLEGARAQFALGRSTNQDVVDAENDLLAASNQLARAISDYRIAVLEFRLSTGTLRITDDGWWGLPEQEHEGKEKPDG
ncbi:MAG: TolC family protein [Planctomycetota bacterium]|nr:MAG: TolC family protein [Planctomycetota bacterium]